MFFTLNRSFCPSANVRTCVRTWYNFHVSGTRYTLKPLPWYLVPGTYGSSVRVVVIVVVLVVLTSTHRYNALRGHRRTGSNNSGAEDYLRRKTNKKQKIEYTRMIRTHTQKGVCGVVVRIYVVHKIGTNPVCA